MDSSPYRRYCYFDSSDYDEDIYAENDYYCNFDDYDYYDSYCDYDY